jgi:hypothetical protein
MKIYRLLAMAGLLLLACATPLVAQETPPPPAAPGAPAAPADPLKAVRAKDSLSDEERGTVRTWVGQRVSAIETSEGPAAQAVRELKSEFNGTNGFKEAYTAAFVEAARPAFKRAKVGPAAQLLTALAALNETATYPVFIDALKDERAAVRQLGGVGLRNLRAKISLAGPGPFGEALSTLRDAALKESAPVLLQTLYQALNYAEVGANSPDPRANIAAVLDVLDARSQQYKQQYEEGQVKAEAADAAGLHVAGALRGQMADQDRERFTLIAARMLKYAVIQYTQSQLYKLQDKSAAPQALQRRDRLELLIEEAEKQLADLVAPPPGKAPAVSVAMKKGNAAGTETVIEMKKRGDLLQKYGNEDFHVELSPDAEKDAAEKPKKGEKPKK